MPSRRRSTRTDAGKPEVVGASEASRAVCGGSLGDLAIASRGLGVEDVTAPQERTLIGHPNRYTDRYMASDAWRRTVQSSTLRSMPNGASATHVPIETFGDGLTCAKCGHPVAPSQRLSTVVLRGLPYGFHVRCYRAWCAADSEPRQPMRARPR